MSLILPSVGTSHLLELLSPYAPDDFIAEVCPRQCTGGRRHALSASQLWRAHLLAVLTISMTWPLNWLRGMSLPLMDWASKSLQQ